jgi:hypothetical protein
MNFELATFYLLGGAVLLVLLICFINILFVISIYKTTRRIPKQYYRFPIWFCWLILIPIIGVIFMYLVLPFGLPFALKAYAPDDQLVQRKAQTLFGVGLAYVVVLTLSAAFYLFGLVAFVLWIIYWVKVVDVRQYLNTQVTNKAENLC